MNAAEIEAACEATSSYFWEGLFQGSKREIPGIGTIEVVDTNESGYDDYSGQRWLIIRVGDKLYRKDGVYYSHDGIYWDGRLYEAKAVIKTITDYEEVK